MCINFYLKQDAGRVIEHKSDCLSRRVMVSPARIFSFVRFRRIYGDLRLLNEHILIALAEKSFGTCEDMNSKLMERRVVCVIQRCPALLERISK